MAVYGRATACGIDRFAIAMGQREFECAYARESRALIAARQEKFARALRLLAKYLLLLAL
jgi:hypothetical protein